MFKYGMRAVHPGEVLREDYLLPLNMSANALAQALTDFNAAGPAPFIARWNALHAWRGETVAVLRGLGDQVGQPIGRRA